jgi:hypothetical protein
VESGFDPQPAQTFFEPGQSDTTSFVVLVPVSRFNTVAVGAWYITGRKDRLTIQPSDESELKGNLSEENGTGIIWTDWSIETELWSDVITKHKRYLHIDYSFAGESELPYQRPSENGMQYSVYADAEEFRTEPLKAYNERLAKTYGINQVGTYTEIALDERPK